MYKKFLEDMVRNAIMDEFGFTCSLDACNIVFKRDKQLDILLDFEFETIFEDCKVQGWICINGVPGFLKDENYHTTMSYYNR